MALLKGKISRNLIRIVASICAFSACLTMIGITLARYVSESNADGNATVALFSPSWVSENIDISGVKKPGDRVEKDFEIRNYTGENLSEVCIQYKIPESALKKTLKFEITRKTIICPKCAYGIKSS